MNTSIIRSIGFADPDAKIEVHTARVAVKKFTVLVHEPGKRQPKSAVQNAG